MTGESLVETGTHHSVALQGLVAILADNKHFLGRRYAEWCTSAPTLESAVAAAAMAQDEIGHARSFYPLLRDIAGDREDGRELEAETRTHFVNVPILDDAFQSWTDFVAANFLLDTSLTVLIESARASSFGPLGQRARRIMEEEPLHWLHAEGWTKRLAARGGPVRGALASSMMLMAPHALSVFDVASPELFIAGILGGSAETTREVFRLRVNGILAPSELPLV